MLFEAIIFASPPMKFLVGLYVVVFFFFSSRRRHTRLVSDWSSDVCSSDLALALADVGEQAELVAEAADLDQDDALADERRGLEHAHLHLRLAVGRLADQRDRKSVV